MTEPKKTLRLTKVARPPRVVAPTPVARPVEAGRPYRAAPATPPAASPPRATPKPMRKRPPPSARLRNAAEGGPAQAPRNTAPAPAQGEGERLSKRIMALVPCSRSEAEKYIEGGWVTVDGSVVEEPQFRVHNQTVHIDPEASLMELSAVTLIMHKPPGLSDGLDDLPPPSARKPSGKANMNVRNLLDAAHHWGQDASGNRLLQRHFKDLDAVVPMENGASGLVVFTQDWRVLRKLSEDLLTMEHELMVDVQGEVSEGALAALNKRLEDNRGHPLPPVKASVNSTTEAHTRLRFAIKGAHPGLVAYLCERAGLTILAMRRVRLGRVALGELPVGNWRYLSGHELF